MKTIRLWGYKIGIWLAGAGLWFTERMRWIQADVTRGAEKGFDWRAVARERAKEIAAYNELSAKAGVHCELVYALAHVVPPQVYHAALKGGAMDGGSIEVKEGVRAVAVLLLKNYETGFVESYERKDGVYVNYEGRVAGLYVWQRTVGSVAFGKR